MTKGLARIRDSLERRGQTELQESKEKGGKGVKHCNNCT